MIGSTLRTSSRSLSKFNSNFNSFKQFSTSLPSSTIYHSADQKTFEDRIISSGSQKVCLAKFTATWCPPCKVLKPILEKMESEKGLELTGKEVDLMEIDVDEQQELAMKYKVRAMPTVIAFQSGKPLKSFMGALPESQVIDFIKSL